MRALAWLVGAALLFMAAGALPSLALFTIGAGMVALVVAGAVTVVAARMGLSVTRLIAAGEIREDEPLRIRFDVAMPRWLPARLQVRDGDGVWTELGHGGATIELTLRRGAYRIDPSRLRLSDAMGVFRRKVRVGEPEPILVLPVPDTGARAAPRQGPSAEATEPDGLRPYVPGVPISRIHWLSLAQGRGLHVRRLGPPPTGLPLVVVDTTGATEPAALDWLARVAAGCVLLLSRQGGCEVLLPGAATPIGVTDEESWRTVHRRLALLDVAPVRAPAGGSVTVIRIPDGLRLDGPRPAPPPEVVPVTEAEGARP